MHRMNASQFKAKCLAVLDEVASTGEGVTILKHGRPVAQLLPVAAKKGESAQEGLLGSVSIVGDILEPVLPANDWEAERRR